MASPEINMLPQQETAVLTRETPEKALDNLEAGQGENPEDLKVQKDLAEEAKKTSEITDRHDYQKTLDEIKNSPENNSEKEAAVARNREFVKAGIQLMLENLQGQLKGIFSFLNPKTEIKEAIYKLQSLQERGLVTADWESLMSGAGNNMVDGSVLKNIKNLEGEMLKSGDKDYLSDRVKEGMQKANASVSHGLSEVTNG